MRREIMKSDWEHILEEMSVKWSLLGNEMLCEGCDQHDDLVQKLQDLYHLSKEDAENEVESFVNIYHTSMRN